MYQIFCDILFHFIFQAASRFDQIHNVRIQTGSESENSGSGAPVIASTLLAEDMMSVSSLQC